MTESLHASLKRLGTDYLDLYYCHRYDPDTPVEEIVQTMDTSCARARSCSGAPLSGVRRRSCRLRLCPPVRPDPTHHGTAAVQLFHRKRLENELAPWPGIRPGLTVFCALYYGILSGKYIDGVPEGSRATLPEMSWIRDLMTPRRIQKVRDLTPWRGNST